MGKEKKRDCLWLGTEALQWQWVVTGWGPVVLFRAFQNYGPIHAPIGYFSLSLFILALFPTPVPLHQRGKGIRVLLVGPGHHHHQSLKMGHCSTHPEFNAADCKKHDLSWCQSASRYGSKVCRLENTQCSNWSCAAVMSVGPWLDFCCNACLWNES